MYAHIVVTTTEATTVTNALIIPNMNTYNTVIEKYVPLLLTS